MPVLDQDEKQDEFPSTTPDPYVYQPQEDDEEEEIDRRIRRADERLRRLTIVGAPDDSDDLESCDTTVAGAWDTGYEVNKTCVSKQTETPPTGACCIDGSCSITTETLCNLSGGVYQGDGTTCSPNPCGGGGCASHTFLAQLIGTCGLGTCACTICPDAYNGVVPLTDPVNCISHDRIDGIACCTCTTGTCDTSTTYVEVTITDNFYALGGGMFGAKVDIEINQGYSGGGGCIYFVSLTVGAAGEFPSNAGTTLIDLVAAGVCAAGDAKLNLVLV